VLNVKVFCHGKNEGKKNGVWVRVSYCRCVTKNGIAVTADDLSHFFIIPIKNPR
jgi:hypothetical protein